MALTLAAHLDLRLRADTREGITSDVVEATGKRIWRVRESGPGCNADAMQRAPLPRVEVGDEREIDLRESPA